MGKKNRIKDPQLSSRPSPTALERCELCLREGVLTTEHHLVPRELGGALLGTVDLCIACHKQIHSLFTNAQLAGELSTLAALREQEEMRTFLKWIRKQPATLVPRIRKSRRMRGQ